MEVAEIVFNMMEVIQMDGSSWLCFRLRDDDDIGDVGIVLTKAYCRWLESTGKSCPRELSQSQVSF